MEFSTKLKEREITIDGASYKLIEFDGMVRATYMNLMQKRIQVMGNNQVLVKDHAGFYSSLISLCLVDSTGAKVDAKVIDKWPASMQKELFEMCQAMNGLGELAESDAKNE